MESKKIIFKSDNKYYLCNIRGGELAKKVPVSKETADLIIAVNNSISFVESADKGEENVK
ncbi:MAG: hypothetical protein ACYCTB_09305 [bacterium]